MRLRACEFTELPRAPARQARAARVHRLEDDPEEPERVDDKGIAEPEIAPFVEVDAVTGDIRLPNKRRNAMPRGVYERKPRADEPAADAVQPRRKRRKRGAMVVAKVKSAGALVPFGASLDLRTGAITINAAAGSLALAPDEVMALLGFLRR